jgi:hypothetical protein
MNIYSLGVFCNIEVGHNILQDGLSKKVAAKPKKPAAHPKYSEMVGKAIAALKERGGSSRQAILKYIMANFNVDLFRFSCLWFYSFLWFGCRLLFGFDYFSDLE